MVYHYSAVVMTVVVQITAPHITALNVIEFILHCSIRSVAEI